MALTARTAAIVLGVILILVGILGFIPNPLVSADGLFMVNTAHNLVHIVTGVVLVGGAYSGVGGAMVLKVVGIVYVLIAILGFVMTGDMLLGFIMNNMADRWLHVVLAIVFLVAGFALPAGEDRRAMM